MSQSQKGAPRLMGTVTSNKMEKTITVMVEHREKHALYGKYISRSHKVHAHDESNECQIGDRVTVEQCRPLSKSKTWKLVEVVERAGLE